MLSKIYRRVRQLSLLAFNKGLQPIENSLVRKYTSQGRAFPPLFIIGPPRTGTTLLYQVLARHFRTVYFSNLAADYFPYTPLLATIPLTNAGKQSPDYTSNYGRTSGLHSPSEATTILWRWFPHRHPSYVDPSSIPLTVFRGFPATVYAISGYAQASMVVKNAWNCFRLVWLSQLLPNALFIVTRRNIVESAESDLEARLKVKSNPNAWNSASPKEYEIIRSKPYWEQVVDQQYFTWKQIYADACVIGEKRFIDIWYEDLCERPGEEMQRLSRFVSEHGGQVDIQCALPERFFWREERKISHADYDRIHDYALQLGETWLKPPKR